VETPIGYLPKEGSLDTSGLDISPEALKQLFEVKPSDWKEEVQEMRRYTAQFGDRLPAGLKKQMDALEKRVSQA
jgi:phosphoenolpyruvate carboxykinase (GTP)